MEAAKFSHKKKWNDSLIIEWWSYDHKNCTEPSCSENYQLWFVASIKRSEFEFTYCEFDPLFCLDLLVISHDDKIFDQTKIDRRWCDSCGKIQNNIQLKIELDRQWRHENQSNLSKWNRIHHSFFCKIWFLFVCSSLKIPCRT